MSTKTISIDLVAYERLKNARIGPKDSFYQVIRRAQWQQEAKTCGGLLAALEELPAADEALIQLLECAQQQDLPPALARGIPLVTNNSAHFSRIPGLSVMAY